MNNNNKKIHDWFVAAIEKEESAQLEAHMIMKRTAAHGRRPPLPPPVPLAAPPKKETKQKIMWDHGAISPVYHARSVQAGQNTRLDRSRVQTDRRRLPVQQQQQAARVVWQALWQRKGDGARQYPHTRRTYMKRASCLQQRHGGKRWTPDQCNYELQLL
jgi:hypothetical protein